MIYTLPYHQYCQCDNVSIGGFTALQVHNWALHSRTDHGNCFEWSGVPENWVWFLSPGFPFHFLVSTPGKLFKCICASVGKQYILEPAKMLSAVKIEIWWILERLYKSVFFLKFWVCVDKFAKWSWSWSNITDNMCLLVTEAHVCLGLAGLLLCCETRSCHARRRNDLQRLGESSFAARVLYVRHASKLRAWILCVVICAVYTAVMWSETVGLRTRPVWDQRNRS